MNVGIIGAGTMGLTFAHRLGEAGARVTVLEGAPQVGGLATWFDYGDFVWDKYYHVILRSDSHLLGLIGELGLASRMRWTATRTGFLWRGRHLSMSNHWEFLTFPALSLWDKARLAAGILRAQRINDPAPLEKITAVEWLQRLFGRRVYEAIWAPLLESKYGALADQTPATIMWATIRRYYSTRGKGGGQETLGSLTGGLRSFFDALTQAVEEKGGVIRRGEPVVALDDSNPGKVVVATPRSRFEFDRVISTLPTALLRKAAPGLRGMYEGDGRDPRFLGVVCLALALRRPLSPYYITNLIQRGFPFTGVIEVSNLTGVEELNGRRLVMLPRYDVPESPWFERDAGEIAEEFLAQLRAIWPDIGDNLVRWFVHRARRVQALWIDAPPPLPQPRHTPDGRVWSVNAEIAGRDTLNNNAIVRVANDAAEAFLKDIS